LPLKPHLKSETSIAKATDVRLNHESINAKTPINPENQVDWPDLEIRLTDQLLAAPLFIACAPPRRDPPRIRTLLSCGW
jgi:hypothetical protein